MIKNKYSINIQKTDFPMKGNLVELEKKIINKWKKNNIYQYIRKKFKNKPKFILHDGPPYANGNIHIGHAVNKILKDIIIKSRCLLGYDAHYIPGWDCHGMPIEIQIEKKFGKKMSVIQSQLKARIYAKKQIEKQKNDFIRLGVIANWNNSYTTMDFSNEANELRVFGKLLKKGYIYRGLKPVHWCFNCKSALAEAEIEYKNINCNSIYIGFPFIEYNKLAKIFNLLKLPTKKGFIIIWTTTPWSLISNQAISLNPKFRYSLVKVIKNKKIFLLIIAQNLVKICLKKFNLIGKIISTIDGKLLSSIKFRHPLYKIDKFYNRLSPVFLGNNIKKNSGTGIVHIAPAYGIEDFFLYKKNNLKDSNILNSITSFGYYKKSIPLFAKLNIWKVTNLICLKLKESRLLFKIEKIKHKYMHCWRHKTPTIYKTTLQWFVGMDIIPKNEKENLREKAIKNINNIIFFTKGWKNYFKNMILNRPDWTLSRQRQWGVPIALFLHKKTNKLHPNTTELLKIIAKKIEKNGIEIWQTINLEKLTNNLKESKLYIKNKDTLDVWFDSGITHKTVLKKKYKNFSSFPADLYLEGIDQYRGWFHSSLLTSLMLNNIPPYKALLTHGFVVDKYGKKMSKSNGNVISPKNITNSIGAEILRLWVSTTNYSNELSISKEILNRVIEIYRKIRNTIRFLLSNIKDFNKKKDFILEENMLEIDKYAIININNLQIDILKNYNKYQFHIIISKLQIYCSEELGSFYLDIIKDRLYTNNINSISRRSAQTAIWHITKSILCIISPILSFTAEEAWYYFLNKNFFVNDKETIFIQNFHKFPKILNSNKILKKFFFLKKIKNKITKKIEKFKILNNIGSSLKIKIKLKIKKNNIKLFNSLGKNLKFIFITSFFKIVKILYKKNEKIKIYISKYKKCNRCWHYCVSIGLNNKHKILCKRCINNLFRNGEKRFFI